MSFNASERYFEELKKYAKIYFLNILNDKNSVLPTIDLLFVFQWHSEIADEDLEKMKNLKAIQSLLAGPNNIPIK